MIDTGWARAMLGLLALLAACSSERHLPSTWTGSPTLPREIRLAVLPIAIDAGLSDLAPSRENRYRLTAMLLDHLRSREGHHFLPFGELLDRFGESELWNLTDRPKEMCSRLTKLFTLDGVLFGRVTVFNRRVGGAYSASRPAEVAFALRLMTPSCQDEAQASWRRMQAALSEDIGRVREFFTAHGRWLTAEELFRVGLEEALDSLFARRAGPSPAAGH